MRRLNILKKSLDKISIAQDKYPLADTYRVYESMVGPYEQCFVTCCSLKNFAAI